MLCGHCLHHPSNRTTGIVLFYMCPPHPCETTEFFKLNFSFWVVQRKKKIKPPRQTNVLLNYLLLIAGMVLASPSRPMHAHRLTVALLS